MLTGKEVLNRALQLLGYTNSYGEIDMQQDAELLKKGSTAIQQIFNDLQRIEHPGRFDTYEIKMNEPLPLQYITVNDVMPYGVAMVLAQSESNGDSQALYAELYNRKRSSVPREPSYRTDVLPKVEG